jgi:hypothetical protein
MGEVRDIRDLEMSLDHHWTAQLKATGGDYRTFVAPYRHSDHGWFDYQPFSPIFPTSVWNMSMAEADWQFLEKLRQVESYNWDVVVSYRGKEDAGHEQPWLRYLAGDNPSYPEASLQAAYDQVSRRLTLIREDQADLTQVHIHHWQQLNPVTTEALLQLTTGGPQIIYNGGLLHTRVRYFDQDRRRPGLPLDVAALVEKVEAEQTTINLINLSPFETHNLIIQAGAFGEHQITAVTYDRRTSDYPGEQASYTAPTLEQKQQTETVADKFLHVQLPPATQVTLTLTMARYTNQPSYELPPL